MVAPRPNEIKILIVEDEGRLKETLVKLFTIFGFNVVAADNGEDAIQKVKETGFDLILTDVRMPKLNGTHLLQEVKQINPQFPKVFIISGFMDFSLDELLHWGADGFFSKPFDSTAVRKALTEALLDPRQRWAHKPKESPTFMIHKRYKNLAAAKSEREFAFGRCGFFVQAKFDKPAVGQIVQFNVEFNDHVPSKTLEGIGRVVWVRDQDQPGRTQGFGVEFLYLEQQGLEKFLKWSEITKVISFIPSL